MFKDSIECKKNHHEEHEEKENKKRKKYFNRDDKETCNGLTYVVYICLERMIFKDSIVCKNIFLQQVADRREGIPYR